MAQRLKAALIEGRAKAEKLLLKDSHGRRCAERICRLEDEIIRVLFDFARKHLYPSQNPSEAERMAIVATGGYGRGLQAPGSDIDLLFLPAGGTATWARRTATRARSVARSRTGTPRRSPATTATGGGPAAGGAPRERRAGEQGHGQGGGRHQAAATHQPSLGIGPTRRRRPRGICPGSTCGTTAGARDPAPAT